MRKMQIEHRARELANTVAALSGYPTHGYEYKNIILKACRKSVIDGFPLQGISWEKFLRVTKAAFSLFLRILQNTEWEKTIIPTRTK